MPGTKDPVARAARTLAGEVTSARVNFGDIACDHPEAFHEYMSAATNRAREKDVNHAPYMLTLDEQVALYKAIAATLANEEARQQLWRYNEALDLQREIEKEAAFDLGIVIGRRLAGGVR
jgi:hypothetical protein